MRPFIITSKTFALFLKDMTLDQIKGEVLCSGLDTIVVCDNMNGPILKQIPCRDDKRD